MHEHNNVFSNFLSANGFLQTIFHNVARVDEYRYVLFSVYTQDLSDDARTVVVRASFYTILRFRIIAVVMTTGTIDRRLAFSHVPYTDFDAFGHQTRTWSPGNREVSEGLSIATFGSNIQLKKLLLPIVLDYLRPKKKTFILMFGPMLMNGVDPSLLDDLRISDVDTGRGCFGFSPSFRPKKKNYLFLIGK